MATKHNKWMKILEVVFTALAGIFGSLKIKQQPKADNPLEADDKTINNDD